MTNYTQHTPATAPERSVATLEAVANAYGFLPNLIATYAESPALLEGYVKLADIFGSTSLTPTEQQVVLLTVSRFHECEYCVAAHTTISIGQQIDKSILDALRNDTPINDSKLQTLREFTLHLVEQRGWADEAQIAKLLEAGYTKQTVLDVILGVAVKTMSNYTNHVAETPLDDAFASQRWQAPGK